MTKQSLTWPRVLAVAVIIASLWPAVVAAHPVTGRDAVFVRSVTGPAIAPFMYLGAKHMVTGYDHIMFLIGVIFFLYRPRDVVAYVSLFTIGHSLTLLVGVLGGVHANSHLVDAIIGLSVVYKGFENIGGFEHLLGFRPNSRVAVLVFGLCHGFGLATKLQELKLPANGLLTNLFSFNIGVEIGQVLALGAVLIGLAYWRSRDGFERQAVTLNAALMTGGFILLGNQLVGYVVNR